MRIIEVDVEHWRGLTGTLGPLSERLNLICGPNESGKSRFFQALRYALFESHKGTAQHKKDLQSWISPESPSVRVTFEVGTIQYTLAKRYLKGAFAKLSGDGQTLEGDDAEEKLQQLIGARDGGSRETSEGDMGIWPVLMIPQGDSRRSVSDALNNDSHSRLQDLLADEIGTSAISTSGKRLVELAAVERDRYFTATGQEKPVLKQARTRHQEAEDGLLVAKENYEKQSNTAAQLADTRRQREELGPRLELARGDAREARQRAGAARDAKSDRDAKQADRDLAANRKESAHEALESRHLLEAEFTKAKVELDSRRYGCDELAGHEALLIAEFAKAEDAERVALEKRDEAREHFKMAQQAHKAVQYENQIGPLKAKIVAVKANKSQTDELRQKRAEMVEVSSTMVTSLRELEQAVKVGEAQLEGAAMRIAFTAQRDLSINGESIDSGSQKEILVTGREKILLDGIADIDVRLQQGSLEELKSELEEVTSRLEDDLSRLGLADVAAASQAENSWADVTRSIGNLERELDLISSESQAQLEENLVRLQSSLAGLGEVDSNLDHDKAEVAFEESQQALEDRQSERSATEKLLNDQRRLLDTEKATMEQLTKRQSERQVRLDALSSLDDLQDRFTTAERGLGEAQLALDTANERFEALGGDQVTDDATRLERAAAKLEQRQTETKSRLDELQGSLRMLIETGSYEGVQDCEAELELANADLRRLERDAAAAKRLYDVLTDKQQELVDRLTAPVINRIQPYLADIFPGSSLQHGDKLDFTGLHSSNIAEDFGALSGGAQEQFSLMTRIGLAEVFAKDGRLPLVLDDSLVNSDAERIRLVHRALDRASERLQIIVFTCHESLFDALGADFHQRLAPTRVFA